MQLGFLRVRKDNLKLLKGCIWKVPTYADLLTKPPCIYAVTPHVVTLHRRRFVLNESTVSMYVKSREYSEYVCNVKSVTLCSGPRQGYRMAHHPISHGTSPEKKKNCITRNIFKNGREKPCFAGRCW
jgi:hypothetical protein